jgi:hypothetical protein
MLPNDFLERLQAHTTSFAKAVATNEGDWIIKGFIDIYRRIYTISVDTKITSKVLELLLFPMFVEFGKANGLRIELSPHQNFYPDLTFIHDDSGRMFAVDIKSTYRIDDASVNGMTLGAFTGYFRKRDSNKNTLYPYGQYSGHFVLGVIYSKCDDAIDERKIFALDDLEKIPSVIKDFRFFVQPKYRLASSRPGSGNTKNIGSITKIDQLLGGSGPFEKLGEEVYDDYWMFYLTRDMAQALEIERPYTNLKSYLAYKERGVDTLREHEGEIAEIGEDESANDEETE